MRRQRLNLQENIRLTQQIQVRHRGEQSLEMGRGEKQHQAVGKEHRDICSSCGCDWKSCFGSAELLTRQHLAGELCLLRAGGQPRGAGQMFTKPNVCVSASYARRKGNEIESGLSKEQRQRFHSWAPLHRPHVSPLLCCVCTVLLSMQL